MFTCDLHPLYFIDCTQFNEVLQFIKDKTLLIQSNLKWLKVKSSILK